MSTLVLQGILVSANGCRELARTLDRKLPNSVIMVSLRPRVQTRSTSHYVTENATESLPAEI